MPVYAFEGLSADGQTRKGVIEADSAKAARAQLRGQALVPIKVEPVSAQQPAAQRSGAATRRSQRVFGPSALTIWTRQLAGLVSSGLPLERALTSLSDEAEKAPERELVATLRSEVNSGSAFAKALSQHPREFSHIFVAVIGAGEQSGNLGLVLERLADDLEEQQALKSKLIGAALYPAIVSLVAIVIVLFLVTYVVPQVAHVFAGSKHALPVLTVIMISMSSFVRAYGWLMLIAIVLIAISARSALANAAFRQQFDAAWLNLPILGRLSRSYNAARFASTLAMLAAALATGVKQTYVLLALPALIAIWPSVRLLLKRPLSSLAIAAIVTPKTTRYMSRTSMKRARARFHARRSASRHSQSWRTANRSPNMTSTPRGMATSETRVESGADMALPAVSE